MKRQRGFSISGAGKAAGVGVAAPGATSGPSLGADSGGYGDMSFTPLGAGAEVGRSCGILSYKGKHVMLDCGIHPGKKDYEVLPFFDSSPVDLDKIDILLVTHFHLDHAGALPYLTEKTGFRGRIFMTPPTKAVLKMMIVDSIRVGYDETSLYSEADMDSCFRKIEIIDFNQTLEVSGIKFTCYNAGHVLGGAMFSVEIAGVNTLYTGDYSLEDDRHLKAAAIPNSRKTDVLIVESTFGINEHDEGKVRETLFLNHVEKVLRRGGRLLIPVFALGRAQELLLMLEEHWRANPDLQSYPIFYASRMANRALKIYRTYVNMMNDNVQRQLALRNPFAFKHIHNLADSHYDDDEPAVVIASPGMLQSGVSRRLCERWCGDAKNSVLIPGYAVEGTLAKRLMDKPEHIVSAKGRVLPRRCDVEYVSFSAHADYQQTRSFIRQLAPDHVVLVHGADKEMKRMATRLRTMLANSRDGAAVRVDTPRNAHSVYFEFLQTKVAKVIGVLADKCDDTTTVMLESNRLSKRGKFSISASNGVAIKGVLVNQNFSHRIMSPADLKTYTEITVNSIQQRMHVPFWNKFELVEYFLGQVFNNVEPQQIAQTDEKSKLVYKSVLVEGVVQVSRKLPDRVLLQWDASPTNDMIADACVAVVRSAESGPASVMLTSKLCNHDSGSGQSSSILETEVLPLSARQSQIEMALRNVLRNTFKEISVDLQENDEEANTDDEYDTRLDVEVDGTKAVICCKLDGFSAVGTFGIQDCDDESIAETLLRVTANVTQSMQYRTRVA